MAARSNQTKERLLDEAMRLFGERGYDGTSVADIERAAGLTPGAGGLFHHFRTKEDVLAAGIERHLGRLDALRQIRDIVPPLGDLRAELTLLARYVFAELAEERELFRVLFTESRQRPALLAEAVDRIVGDSYREFAAWLRRMAPASSLPGDAETVAAIALGALAHYRILEDLLHRPPIDVPEDSFITTWVEMVVRALQPPRGSQSGGTRSRARRPRRAPG